MAIWQRAKQVIEPRAHLLPLLFGVAWLVVYWLRFPHNYTISDPWLYAYHAHLVAAGTFFKTLSVPNVFAQRFGVLLPVAPFQKDDQRP